MNDTSSSSDPDRCPPSDDADGADQKPFVEPELRCETDLLVGTADRHHFGTLDNGVGS